MPWPSRPPTSSSARPTSPTCSCAAACRSASRTGWSPGWSGVRSSAAAGSPTPPMPTWPSSRRSSTEAASARASGPPSGSSRRCPRAGPRSSGCASSWAGRGPFCARPPTSVLDQSFYARPVVEVARDLIGCVVRHGDTGGRIVETEAYHQEEPACHAYVGLTARTKPLFGAPGVAYVYRSYGIHALLNAVCSPLGEGAAVLIRALEPVEGIEVMRARRRVARDVDLCNGPGKLTQALGIELSENESSLLGDGPIAIDPRAADAPPPRLVAGERIGITRAVELPWRFCDADAAHWVSAPRPPELRRRRRAAEAVR